MIVRLEFQFLNFTLNTHKGASMFPQSVSTYFMYVSELNTDEQKMQHKTAGEELKIILKF